MSGVLDGVEVLDLTTGIAGPMTGMLLADHGARVTKIEPPGGDPTRTFSGAQVWHRGKRSAELDLRDTVGPRPSARARRRAPTCSSRATPRARPRTSASTSTRVHAVNPRLVYCSITAYGDDGRHADRPGYEALVAARTGHQWESRGVPGGTLARLAGLPPAFADLVVPDDCWVGGAPAGPAVRGRAVGEPGLLLPGHARDQRRAPRARADRPRATGRDLAVPGRARHHALGLAAGRARRDRELPELDRRSPRPQGRVPLRRRPVDPPVGAPPRLRPQRGRGRSGAAHREDHPAP